MRWAYMVPSSTVSRKPPRTASTAFIAERDKRQLISALIAIDCEPILDHEMTTKNLTSTISQARAAIGFLGVAFAFTWVMEIASTRVSLLVFSGLLALEIFAAAPTLLAGPGHGPRSSAQPQTTSP